MASDAQVDGSAAGHRCRTRAIPGEHNGRPMDRIVVRGGRPLHGSVAVSGAKNSVLKLMAAAILADGTSHLDNVPDIADVATMSELLGAMGLTVHRDPATPSSLRLERPAVIEPVAPYELVERIRASIVVLGPLLARCGRARVSLPGGDDFGPRPIDMHLRGLEALGADVRAAPRLPGGPGRRPLRRRHHPRVPERGRDREHPDGRGARPRDDGARQRRPRARDRRPLPLPQPHGRQGRGHRSARLVIHGVEPGALTASAHSVVPDRVEAATFLAAAAITGGEVEIGGARPEHMDMLLRKVGRWA